MLKIPSRIRVYSHVVYVSDFLSLGLKASRMCEERMLVSGRTSCRWRQGATQCPTRSHGPGPVRGAQRPDCVTPRTLCAAVSQPGNTTHWHTNILCWFYHNSVCDSHGQNPSGSVCRRCGFNFRVSLWSFCREIGLQPGIRRQTHKETPKQ